MLTPDQPPLQAAGSGTLDEAGAEGMPEDAVPDAATLEQLLDIAGVTKHRELYRSVFSTVLGLVHRDTDTLDLKIAAAAIAEMAEAFKVFQPYRSSPKVTFFGSARTLPEDPLYIQARTPGCPAVEGRLDGRDRSRTGDHGCRHGGGRT